MSDFITTMTARAMGRIPTVEPLRHSMYLTLPRILSDYTEDTLSEPQPSAFIDDEPNLNFKPLVTPKGLSAAMPKWDMNSDLELESFPLLEVEPHLDAGNLRDSIVIPDNRINTETEITFTNAIEEKQDSKLQPATEISQYPIVPQVNQLEVLSQIVEASVDFDSTTSTNTDDGEIIISFDINSGDTNQSQNLANPTNVDQKADLITNILPQVNHLEKASQAVEASVEFDSTTSTNADDGEIIISFDINSGDTNQSQNLANPANVVQKADLITNILPQVNQLEALSQAVEASVEFDSTTSTNTDDGEIIISFDINSGDTNQSQNLANPTNVDQKADLITNILPQVNHLGKASQAVEASVEFDFKTSTSESELHQKFNKIDKPLHEQLTNTQNLPTQIDKLDISSVQNPSSDDNRNQQTQKQIAQKTVTYDLQKRTLLPQVNRLKTAKSVKPDIPLDTTQLNLQNPLQQQRSIHQAEKTTIVEKVKAQTEKSSPSQFNNNSQSQTPIPSQQQSIEPNLHLRSNLVNEEHRNTEFVKKSKIQSSISRVTPNLSEQESVIPPGEDIVSLLPSPIVKTSSPIHTQTDFRRHQAEFQPSATIQVTIGRIEVRGIQPEQSPKPQGRKSTQKSPALSLSDYLKQRDGK